MAAGAETTGGGPPLTDGKGDDAGADACVRPPTDGKGEDCGRGAGAPPTDGKGEAAGCPPPTGGNGELCP